MPSFRFCRSDDVPLLVSMLNACVDVHCPNEPAYTVTRFKREMKEVDLWTSSCMIVREGDEPVGIVTGCKRPEQTLIHSIGVRSEYQRRGYASHMLSSLSGKLAVLGPPIIRAEVPVDLGCCEDLFKKVGFEAVGAFYDYTYPPAGPRILSDMAAAISFGEIERLSMLVDDSGYSWLRDNRRLGQTQERLQGVAISSEEYVESYLLYLESDQGIEILRFYSRSPSYRAPLLGALVRHLAAQEAGRSLIVPRISRKELEPDLLCAIGFEQTREYRVYLAEAKPC